MSVFHNSEYSYIQVPVFYFLSYLLFLFVYLISNSRHLHTVYLSKKCDLGQPAHPTHVIKLFLMYGCEKCGYMPTTCVVGYCLCYIHF